MRTQINLATRPRVNQRGFWLAGSVLLLAALLLTAFVVTEGVAAWQQRMTTRARLGDLNRERSDLQEELNDLEDSLRDPATEKLLEENEFLNHVIRQTAFSWARFFERLSEGLPARARVLSVSPILGEGGRVNVRLRMGARSPAAIHDFMRRLEEGAHFSQVVLQTQEQSVAGGDRITAQLTAVYSEGE